MDFELTNRQKQIRLAAKEFAEGEFPGKAEECDRNESFDWDIWRKACELGFVAVYIKKEYGGLGMGLLEACLILEEFTVVDPGLAIAILATDLGSEAISLFGTEEQKKKYLPPWQKVRQLWVMH